MVTDDGPLTLVVFGKGGVGKSTVTSHLAVAFSNLGKRVLLIGCDPKRDASARFRVDHKVSYVQLLQLGQAVTLDSLILHSESGVDVIETGGAEPGTACAGRGVAGVCQLLEAQPERLHQYDVVLFDVLGDLVCGGFVAPLRYGQDRKVLIVTSEELASLFVANNVARVLLQPSHQQSELVGMVVNLRDADANLGIVDAFSHRLRIPVLETLTREPLILASERQNRTTLEIAPEAPISGRFVELARRLLVDAEPASRPAPMDVDQFWEFVKGL